MLLASLLPASSSHSKLKPGRGQKRSIRYEVRDNANELHIYRSHCSLRVFDRIVKMPDLMNLKIPQGCCMDQKKRKKKAAARVRNGETQLQIKVQKKNRSSKLPVLQAHNHIPSTLMKEWGQNIKQYPGSNAAEAPWKTCSNFTAGEEEEGDMQKGDIQVWIKGEEERSRYCVRRSTTQTDAHLCIFWHKGC